MTTAIDATAVAADEATIESAVETQLRDLATTMNQMVEKAVANGFAIRKAIITAVNSTAVPPTVQLNISGDTQTAVDQVRMVNNFNPQVGQTVLLAKQQSEIFILGAIAASSGSAVGAVDTGWKKATLAAGSHGGNGNGDIYYRRVMDNGSWKMQWRGGWNVSGTTVVSGLDEEFRPTSKRSIVVARDPQGGSNTAQIDFGSDGTVRLVGPTTTPLSSSHSHSFSGSGSGSGSGFGHAHVDGSGFSTTSNSEGSSVSVSVSGSTSSSSHTHPVNSPTWIGFNDVEYFL